MKKERQSRAQRKLSRAREAEIETRGSEARMLGKLASTTPFKEHSPEREAWLRGWWSAETVKRVTSKGVTVR